MLIKKSLLVIFAMLLISFTLNSCKKDVLNPTGLGTNCEASLNGINTATAAWSANPSTATCEGLKDAYSTYINSCASLAGYNASYEELLADWDCSGFDE